MENDPTKNDPITEIDMQVPENFQKAVSLALAASDPTGWADMPYDWVKDLPEKTVPNPDKLWSVYRDDGDPAGPIVSAVTGNGPKSAANAEFYASARKIVLGLVSEVDRLQTQLRLMQEAYE